MSINYKKKALRLSVCLWAVLALGVVGMFAAIFTAIWTGDERWMQTGVTAFFINAVFVFCAIGASVHEEDTK